jgi:hypothetical protein
LESPDNLANISLVIFSTLVFSNSFVKTSEREVHSLFVFGHFDGGHNKKPKLKEQLRSQKTKAKTTITAQKARWHEKYS